MTRARWVLLFGIVPWGIWGATGCADDGAADMGAAGGEPFADGDMAGAGPAAAGDAYGNNGAYCEFDDDCLEGYRCFQNQCVFQGIDEPRPPDGDAGVVPQETELTTLLFSAPAAGLHHVWVTSPTTDRVVRIHGETLEITGVEVGDEPTIVRTQPGRDVAIVLNRGSDELSRVTHDADGSDGSADRVTHFELPHHFNALALSPDGRFAVCWLDIGQIRSGEDASALQDVAVVDLTDDTVSAVAIGFRPSEIVFADDGEWALIVTEDGLSAVHLTELRGASVARTVPLAVSVFRQEDREVAITPDGHYAISRGPGEQGVTLVDIREGVPRFLDLGAEPTDIDLLPDCCTALVMLREAERAALVRLKTDAGEPVAPTTIDLTGFPLGSAVVAASGDVAVLYTTAEETAQVTLLDLVTHAVVHRPLRKGVAGVAIDPTGATAFVLHTKAPGEPDPRDGEAVYLARSHGFTLLNLRTSYAKLQTTPAQPAGLIFRDDGRAGYVLLSDIDRRVAQIQVMQLDAFDVTAYDLGSPPEAVGVLPTSERIFTTQTHSEGRISFIDYEGGRIETVSGYSLNERID